MSVEVERVKKLVDSGLLVEAVELPTRHKSRPIAPDEIEEVLSHFDEDSDHAHFVIRVKRTDKPLPKPLEEPQSPQLSIDTMVTETLAMTENFTGGGQLPTALAPKTKPLDDGEDYDPTFLMENARVLEESGEYELARNIYHAMLRKGEMIPHALFGMARTLEKEGATDRAVRCYQEAIAYSSELKFFQALAALQIKTGDDEDATQTLLHALGLSELNDDQKFELHKSIGNCQTRLGDYTKAEHHYRKAYDLNANSDALQVNVGSLALQKLDYAAAHKHFLRALELNPKNEKAVSGLGMVCLGRGETREAHDWFVKSLQLNLGNLGAIYNLVKCAYELRQFNEASRILKEYIRTNPVNTNIMYSFAGILYHEGELTAALAEVEKILASNAAHTGAKELKEIIQGKLGTQDALPNQ